MNVEGKVQGESKRSVLQMRPLKKSSDPGWDEKESPDHRTSDSVSKRRRRSLSGALKNKHCKEKSSEVSDSSCSENKCVKDRDHLDQHCAGECRNECNEGCDTEHLSNKSSGHGGTKRRPQTPYTACHHHSQDLISFSENVVCRYACDTTGHRLVVLLGDEIVATLGEGGFGQVVECIDHKAAGRHVAVKIAKNLHSYSEAAHAEIRVLQNLNAWDPSSTYRCVKMLEWFEYHGHVCIVFELLGLSTYSFMKLNHFLPLRMEHIRHIAYQICTSVNFLHQHKLTHADLKPGNIVLVNSDYTEEYNPQLKCEERTLKNPDIKIVDFGFATYDHESHCTLVSTRPYRAPEVILALGWSQPCDVWSIGCTLLEYYLGETVFATHNSKEHLAMMERVLGPLPNHMIKKTRKREYFRQEQLDWDEQSLAGCYVALRCRPLMEFMMCHNADHKHLFDLIEKMLEYDPDERITLAEALEHPFFFPLKQQAQGSLPSTP